MLRAMGGMGDAFGVGLGRVAIHNDIQRMIDTDPTIASGLRAWASNVCAPNGEDETIAISSEDEKVQQILEECRDRLRANRNARDWIYSLKGWGNLFWEIVVDNKLRVVDLKVLPEEQIQIRRDAQGNLGMTTDAQGNPVDCAPYVQTMPGDYLGKGIEFERWQIVHLAEPPEKRDGFGTSCLESVRRDWKSLQYIDQSMIMARIERAFLKFNWIIPIQVGSTQAEFAEKVKAFKESITQRELGANRGDTNTVGGGAGQVTVSTDRFLGSLWTQDKNGQVQTIQPTCQVVDPENKQLQNISDVEYIQHKCLVALAVPPAILGFEEDINSKSTLTGQVLEFGRRVKDLQNEMKSGLRQVFDLELLLNGYVPGSVEYEIILPEIQMTDTAAAANTELTRAETARILSELDALDAEAVATHFTTLTADEAQEIRDRIKAKAKATPKPPLVPMVVPQGEPMESDMRAYLSSGQLAEDLYTMAEVLGGNGYHVEEERARVG
jgi:hypothetical protein